MRVRNCWKEITTGVRLLWQLPVKNGLKTSFNKQKIYLKISDENTHHRSRWTNTTQFSFALKKYSNYKKYELIATDINPLAIGLYQGDLFDKANVTQGNRCELLGSD